MPQLQPTLIASPTSDPYSTDADRVVDGSGAEGVVELRVDGNHAQDSLRLDRIVEWLVARAAGDE